MRGWRDDEDKLFHLGCTVIEGWGGGLGVTQCCVTQNQLSKPTNLTPFCHRIVCMQCTAHCTHCRSVFLEHRGCVPLYMTHVCIHVCVCVFVCVSNCIMVKITMSTATFCYGNEIVSSFFRPRGSHSHTTWVIQQYIKPSQWEDNMQKNMLKDTRVFISMWKTGRM